MPARPPAHRRSSTFIVLIVAVALLLLGCQPQATPGGDSLEPGFFTPEPGSTAAQTVDTLYGIVFWIAVAIFVLVEGLLLWIVLRYRRKSDQLPRQVHGNNLLEILWTAIPAVLVMGLFVLTLVTLETVEAGGPGQNPPFQDAEGESRDGEPALIVDATGFQWQWTFDYEREDLSFTGQGSVGPQMVVPVGERVRVRLHSNDVNHAFYVPHFLYKKDVIPGRVNELEFVVPEPATYTGQCAEFCGLSHAQMYFTIRAVPRAEYDAWVAAEQEKANATPAPAPSAAPGQSPGAGQPATVQISASNSQSFDQTAVEAPADVPLSIPFQNNDPAAPHNVAIKQATAEGDFIGQPIANAGQQVTYQAPALAAGDYQFYCSVHPNMQGTLTVQ